MADEKYSIDDILKEFESSKSSSGRKRSNNNDIDTLISSGRQQKKDFSVTEVIDSIGKQRNPVRSAKQRTDSEVETRIARDISRAADKKRAFYADDEDDDVIEYAAKQRTDAETEARIARDVSNAADLKRYEELSGGYSRYDDEDEEDVKTYSPENDRNYDNENDDIELHDISTFTPSETMEMRRMKKLNEFKDVMLKYDSEADSPDDMLDSLNPMESREKAAEQLKDSEDTDTLAVSGNDLKAMSKGEERIKEYTPSASRKREQPAAARQSPFTGELHVGESIIDALNKKINEQSSDIDAVPDLNIGEPETGDAVEVFEENVELEKIRQANELAQKRKRKLSEFILDTRDDTEESDRIAPPKEEYDEYEDEDDEEPIDLNDENVIRDRLERASKGLWGRLIILGVLFLGTMFIAMVNVFNLRIGRIGSIISYRTAPTNYLYTHLVIGILSFAACSSVISNGLSRLIKLRPDGDTLCAFAHAGAIIAMIPYLAKSEYIQRGYSQIYLAVSLAALIFNTVSKLLTVKTAQENFKFVFGTESKYFIEHCDGNAAQQLAKGFGKGMPSVASMRKTEMLCDFIVSTYCEDSSDRTSRKTVPIVLFAALIGGIVGYFTCSATIMKNHASWAATVSSAILAVSAAFSSSMTVTLPMYLAARMAKERGSAILGFASAEEMSETNAVLADAKMLFPPEAVKIVNICGYDTPKTRGEGKINIDEAIIYAASLAVASDSILADSLFHILNYKRELLKSVSGCVYENNLGVMGWIDRRRVLLGTRAHMKAHEITVPNTKKETAANKNNDEVIYLAVGGEVCLLFFVRPMAVPEVRRAVRELAFRDISIVIRTVDGMITAPTVARVFGINEEDVKILPYELHETFEENTKFVSSGSAAVSCNGTFRALADSVTTARTIRDRATIGNIMQFSGIIVGIVTMLIFTLTTKEAQLSKLNLFNMFYVMLFNTIWSAITLGIQFFRRT